MAWIKWVARPDVPFKDAYHHMALPDAIKEANIWGYSELRELAKIDLLYIGNIIHLVRERNVPFYLNLIKIFDSRNSHCYLDIAAKYEKLAKELLDYTQRVYDTDLLPLKDEQLQGLLEGFAKHYMKYCPILNSGVAVDWLYRDRYDAYVREMAMRMRSQLAEHPPRCGEPFSSIWDYFDDDLVSTTLEKALREALTISLEPTFGEQKEDAMWKLAVEIAKTPDALVLLTSEPSDYSELQVRHPSIAKRVEDCYQEYRWTKMWSFPPRYAPTTLDEFLSELQPKLKPGAEDHYKEMLSEKRLDRERYEALLSQLSLTQKERDFIDTVNYYQYFRTWRMEVLTKSQYQVTPLLQEIGKRLGLGANDIFYLTHREIMESLQTSTVPDEYLRLIGERREGYAIWTHDGEWTVYSGNALARFMDEFLATINYLENGRGPYYHEAEFVGGKANNLFKLVEGKFNVPKFFVVTSRAFGVFVSANGLESKLRDLVSSGNEETYQAIEALFVEADFPQLLRKAVFEQVEEVGLKEVAVRSSATIEDSELASWAGRFRSYTYVPVDKLTDSVKRVWASLYHPMALRYAREREINLEDHAMAVVVQDMVDPEVSGVVNTRFSSRDAHIMEIEAVRGQGEAIVSGAVTPDTYYVDKRTWAIVERSVVAQTQMVTRQGLQDLESPIDSQKLSDEQVIELAKTCQDIEVLFEAPQDIEYAIANGKLFILQSRPQTGIDIVEPTVMTEMAPQGKLLVTGLRGKVEIVFRGKARVLQSPDESERFEDGEILVARAVTPAWDPILYRASATVTDEGGSTSHAIRVANERRIPAVVGTGEASKLIKDGDTLVLDTTSRESFRGKVYRI